MKAAAAPLTRAFASSSMKNATKIKVYTRGGDKGVSSLYDGSRVPKTADIFDALGTADELSATIG